jgi:hypothetical protein
VLIVAVSAREYGGDRPANRREQRQRDRQCLSAALRIGRDDHPGEPQSRREPSPPADDLAQKRPGHCHDKQWRGEIEAHQFGELKPPRGGVIGKPRRQEEDRARQNDAGLAAPGRAEQILAPRPEGRDDQDQTAAREQYFRRRKRNHKVFDDRILQPEYRPRGDRERGARVQAGNAAAQEFHAGDGSWGT